MYLQDRYKVSMIKLNLESLLQERGRSFYWLAKNAGIHQAMMSRMRHQDVKAITLDVLDRICDALECSPGDVLIKVKSKGTARRRKS
jgi:putative transcriptional regulator